MVEKDVDTSAKKVVDVCKRALAFARATVLAAATPVELLRSLASKDLRRGFPKYYRSRLRMGVANVATASVLTQTRRARLI